MEVDVQSFLTSAVDEGTVLVSRPCRLTLGTNWVAGWVPEPVCTLGKREKKNCTFREYIEDFAVVRPVADWAIHLLRLLYWNWNDFESSWFCLHHFYIFKNVIPLLIIRYTSHVTSCLETRIFLFCVRPILTGWKADMTREDTGELNFENHVLTSQWKWARIAQSV